MKTEKITIERIKDDGSWSDAIRSLTFDKFRSQHPEVTDEDELEDLYYDEVPSKLMEWGEYLDIEVKIDENFNIVGGRIIPFKK